MKSRVIGLGIILLTIANSFGETIDSTAQDRTVKTKIIRESLNEKDIAKIKSLNLDGLSEKEFQYLIHTEKMYQDSMFSVQAKSLEVSTKPAGLYKTTAIISIILSTISTTFLTLSFIGDLKDK